MSTNWVRGFNAPARSFRLNRVPYHLFPLRLAGHRFQKSCPDTHLAVAKANSLYAHHNPYLLLHIYLHLIPPRPLDTTFPMIVFSSLSTPPPISVHLLGSLLLREALFSSHCPQNIFHPLHNHCHACHSFASSCSCQCLSLAILYLQTKLKLCHLPSITLCSSFCYC
jgi:hypothetical protein